MALALSVLMVWSAARQASLFCMVIVPRDCTLPPESALRIRRETIESEREKNARIESGY
jgi:hypothetical protein